MPPLMNFKDWLKSVHLHIYKDIDDLYTAVKELKQSGEFGCTQKAISGGNQYFVKCTYIPDGLILNSDKARDFFLNHLEQQFL